MTATTARGPRRAGGEAEITQRVMRPNSKSDRSDGLDMYLPASAQPHLSAARNGCEQKGRPREGGLSWSCLRANACETPQRSCIASPYNTPGSRCAGFVLWHDPHSFMCRRVCCAVNTGSLLWHWHPGIGMTNRVWIAGA